MDIEKIFYEVRPYAFLALAGWAMYYCVTSGIPYGRFWAAMLAIASSIIIAVRISVRSKK
tara:strand:+ start:43889 stop:44068 length:180 start_codon:yes stop_codon:yes gene_type:complete